MKLSITQGGTTLSSIYFNDDSIREIVTFWTNIKYQSPQFPLALCPDINQLGELYPNGLVPQISTSQDATIQVLTDSTMMQNLQIVQVKLNAIGIPDGSLWADHFDVASWVIAPDGTAYLSPDTTAPNQVILPASTSDSNLAVSYKVLVSFQLSDQAGCTYYGNIDPLAKVTNHSG